MRKVVSLVRASLNAKLFLLFVCFNLESLESIFFFSGSTQGRKIRTAIDKLLKAQCRQV